MQPEPIKNKKNGENYVASKLQNVLSEINL
jgi:hypothetical protein